MSDQPNILLIIADQHRGQALSCAGDTNVRTPNLDRLADGGVRFAQARANCPVCTPSRGTIFSGRHAHCGPVQNFWDVYKPGAPSLATILRSEGYRTAYFGKWHCGVVRDQVPSGFRESAESYARSPFRTPETFRGGFQDWFAYEVGDGHFDAMLYSGNDRHPTRLTGYLTDALTDRSISYLEGYNWNEPLFMVVSHLAPHFPLEVPDAWIERRPRSVELRPNVSLDSDIPHTQSRRPDFTDRLQRYYAMVENLDWNVGRLVDGLTSIQGARPTLVVYVSDHGEFMGSHGRIERKEHPHEESVRIPAIFHGDGVVIPQGTRSEPFSLIDVLPTLLGAVHVAIPPYAQGFDYSACLRGDRVAGPDEVLLEMHGSPRWILDLPDWRGLVWNQWKYAVYEDGSELLFDLERDAFELANLAKTDRHMARHMRKRLARLLEVNADPYFPILLEYGVPSEGTAVDVSRP